MAKRQRSDASKSIMSDEDGNPVSFQHTFNGGSQQTRPRTNKKRVEDWSRLHERRNKMFQASKTRLLQQNSDRLTDIPKRLKKNVQQIWSVICQDIQEHWMSYTLSLKTARSILINSTRKKETPKIDSKPARLSVIKIHITTSCPKVHV